MKQFQHVLKLTKLITKVFRVTYYECIYTGCGTW